MVRTHQGAVRAFLRRLCQNAAQADDIAQETFIKAMRAVDSLRDMDTAKSWLLSIAYRQFIDTRRKSARQAAIRDAHYDTLTPAVAQAPAGLALDLTRAMDGLPDECRACVMLVLAEGMSHAQAAEILAMPLGTVKSHITRGRAKLQSALSAYESNTKTHKVTP